MLTAPRLQRPALDLFPTRLHLLGSPEVDVRRGDVAQRFVVALVVVVVHEAADLPLEVPGVGKVLKLDQVLHRALAALDLGLGHRMVGRPARVLDLPAFQEPALLGRHIARPMVREQPGAMTNLHSIKLGARQSKLERFLHVRGRHGRGESPG